MAKLSICDVCYGAVKDEPIYIQLQSNNKMFKSSGSKDQSSEFEQLLPSFMRSKKTHLDVTYELCEGCATRLLVIFERAIAGGKLENEQLHKQLLPLGGVEVGLVRESNRIFLGLNNGYLKAA